MKHIVCIIDGTWQTPTAIKGVENFSNAYNLNTMLDQKAGDENDQVVFYFSGLGSDQKSQPYTGGAFARGLDHQIAEAYINIASNYRISDTGDRDKIYIFGFSRGAVAARAIAGMISRCGLLQPNRMNYYPDIWRAFIRNEEPGENISRYCYSNVDVEMVGVFDTVFGDYALSARFNELTFPDLKLPVKVKAGVHIMAIDESRKFFSPMLWEERSNANTQVLEQIWMPGVHSDVGGVYESRYIGIHALRTMADRIMAHTQLRLNKAFLRVIDITIKGGSFRPHINNELTGLWKMLPKARRSYSKWASQQYLHPVIADLNAVPLMIRNKQNIKYNIDGFRGDNDIPFFCNWHTPNFWKAA